MSKQRAKASDVLGKRPLLSTVLISLALTLILELLNQRSFGGLFRLLAGSPAVFASNFLIVLFTFSLTLLFRRRVFAVTLVGVVWLLLGITDFFTLTLRGTPFSARDLMLLASFFEVAGVYFKVWHMILMAMFVAGIVVLFVFIFRRAGKSALLSPLRRILTVCAAALLAAAACVYMGLTYDLNGDFLFINDAYETCGFPYCFSCSIFQNGIARPRGYSGDEVGQIVCDIDPEPDGVLPNVIFVQLESFIDPSEIVGMTFDEDPVPNFTKLKAECPSGYLSVPTIGGGTVNTEFEVLTGMNIDYFGIGEYPYESVLKDTACESLAYILSDLTPHAIHDHSGSFYDRNIVYSNLGFETFTSLEYMSDVTVNEAGWAEDRILTKYIREALDSTEGRDFIFAVSVQAHGKYPEDEDEPDDGDDYRGMDYYVSQLSGTDEFIGELTDYLRTRREPTVVVFYGDHLPSLGLADEDLASGTLYKTEYAVWHNMRALGGADEDIEAYRLGARAFELIGFSGGILPEYHRANYGAEDYFEGLEMLQYDLLYGDRHAYRGEEPEATDLRMGLDEIKITSAETRSGKSFIYGENFTPFSVVTINGNRRATEFISPSCLAVSVLPAPGDEVSVVQLATDRVELSKTAVYVFK